VTGCALTVCRGCCCGREDPVQAMEMLEQLRADLPGTVIRTSDCLGPCSRKDVVVVQPSARMRRAGSRPVWLAWMGDRRSVAELAGWVREGGPGQAEMPAGLALQVFRPEKRASSRKRTA
jgi:hypothetical protein